MARILAVAIILLSLNGVHADLLNGSFENDGAGWESRWLRGPLTGASAVFDTALAQDGRKSLKVIIPEAGARYRLMQSIPVDPRRAYRVTFSYYTAATQGSSASFRIGPSDAQNQHLGYFGGRDLAPTGHVWIDYEIDFLPPAQARTAAIEFNFIGPIDARLDNVRCEPVSPGREKQLRDLLDIPHPLFESLIVPNSKPDRPRLFPYWSYSPDKAHFTGMALRYGHEYCLPEEFRDCRDRRLAPLFSHWHQRFPDLAKQYDPPVTYYLMSHQDIVARAVAAGAVPCRGQHPNPNDPALVQTFVETIRADNDIPRAVDAGRECFYFIYDEMFVGSCQAPDMNARTGPYWKNADAIVKKKYGFGKFGLPDNATDPDPFRWIAYLRWQADESVDTLATLAAEFRKKAPKATILGPDEFAMLCPLDWDRIGRVVDIATGQTLCSPGGFRQYNVGYLVKLHRDLTRRPVYPYVQLIKYGASPSIETVYSWADQVLQNGGAGLFVGAVEWFDRDLNHPRYAAPRKWQAVLNIVDTMQKLGRVRLPDDHSLALHFGSYTQMTRNIAPDQNTYGAAYAVLGPRARAWFTFTDDFQIDRNPDHWRPYRVVIIPDARYVSETMLKAIDTFVRNGGVAIVTDPRAFSYRLDGTDLGKIRQTLLGVTFHEAKNQSRLLVHARTLPLTRQSVPALAVTNPAETAVLAKFPDGSPAIVERKLGKGWVRFFAANTNTELTVDHPDWIAQWREWLTELKVPVNQDIWRFQLPRVPLPPESTDRCLTGNAICFDRNFPDVSVNEAIPGTYRYAHPPRAIPEKHAAAQIPFTAGQLTNRREMLALKKNTSGDTVQTERLPLENWVVRFGPDQLQENAVTFDLTRPFPLTRLRWVYSGVMPAVRIEGSRDGATWTPLATVSATNAEDNVLVAEAKLKGEHRYLRLLLGPREAGTSFTLAEIDIWGRPR